MSVEVWNIHQIHEYCNNYLPHQEENIYIQIVVKLAILTNSMNIVPTIFPTRKEIYIYIMNNETWNIHQFKVFPITHRIWLDLSRSEFRV